jgi:hypothetical protein
VAWQQIEGETILLDLAASTYLGVNGAGTVLWPGLVEGCTREELVSRMCDAYDVDRAQAAVDVKAFLAECRGRGFLEP